MKDENVHEGGKKTVYWKIHECAFNVSSFLEMLSWKRRSSFLRAIGQLNEESETCRSLLTVFHCDAWQWGRLRFLTSSVSRCRWCRQRFYRTFVLVWLSAWTGVWIRGGWGFLTSSQSRIGSFISELSSDTKGVYDQTAAIRPWSVGGKRTTQEAQMWHLSAADAILLFNGGGQWGRRPLSLVARVGANLLLTSLLWSTPRPVTPSQISPPLKISIICYW